MADRRSAQFLALGLVMDAGTGNLEGPALIHALSAIRDSLGPSDPLSVAARAFTRDVVRISRDTPALVAAGQALFAAVLASCDGTDRAGLAVALSEMPEAITTPDNVILLGARRPNPEASA